MATMYNPPHLGEFHSHYRSLDDRLHRRGKAIHARWYLSDYPIVPRSLHVAVASSPMPVVRLSGLRTAFHAHRHMPRKEQQGDFVSQLVQQRGCQYRCVLAVPAFIVQGLVGESRVLIVPRRYLVRRVRQILYERYDQVLHLRSAQPRCPALLSELSRDLLDERLTVRVGRKQIVVPRPFALPVRRIRCGMQIQRHLVGLPGILPRKVPRESAAGLAARHGGATGQGDCQHHQRDDGAITLTQRGNSGSHRCPLRQGLLRGVSRSSLLAPSLFPSSVPRLPRCSLACFVVTPRAW